MSDDNTPAPVAASGSTAEAAPVPAISIWPAAVLREQLRSADAAARLRALAQAVQPAAPLNECVDDVVHCATLSADDWPQQPFALELRYARSLSGGNLQKFIVGREIMLKPKLMIVAQPTWGVDVGASAVLRQALLDLSRNGVAIVLIS